MFCHAFLSRILYLLRTLVRVFREIVREVLGVITRALSALAAMTDHVFSALPWPLNKILGLVTRVVEGLAEGFDWLSEEVINRLIEGGTEIAFEYAAYLLNWIAWLLDWSTRWLAILLCKKGILTPMTIPLRVKVLRDNGGGNAMQPDEVYGIIDQANRILESSNLQFVHAGDMEFIQQQRYFNGVEGGLSGFFRRYFSWFSARAEPGCVTVFVVREMEGGHSCAYPGANWLVIDSKAAGSNLVHAIGHLSDLWRHSTATGDVMSEPSGPYVLDDQTCMIRTSKFARLPRLDDLI
jgi:hypothetical protein